MDPMRGVLWGFDIAASGLTAELRRSEIVASNIANMHVTGGNGREPYRRRAVVFEEVLDDVSARWRGTRGAESLARGVRVGSVFEDHVTPFVPVYSPGHRDADENGYILTSNVDMFREMVDMMTIERSFQANLATMQAYRTMVRNSIQHIGRS